MKNTIYALTATLSLGQAMAVNPCDDHSIVDDPRYNQIQRGDSADYLTTSNGPWYDNPYLIFSSIIILNPINWVLLYKYYQSFSFADEWNRGKELSKHMPPALAKKRAFRVDLNGIDLFLKQNAEARRQRNVLSFTKAGCTRKRHHYFLGYRYESSAQEPVEILFNPDLFKRKHYIDEDFYPEERLGIDDIFTENYEKDNESTQVKNPDEIHDIIQKATFYPPEKTNFIMDCLNNKAPDFESKLHTCGDKGQYTLTYYARGEEAPAVAILFTLPQSSPASAPLSRGQGALDSSSGLTFTSGL